MYYIINTHTGFVYSQTYATLAAARANAHHRTMTRQKPHAVYTRTIIPPCTEYPQGAVRYIPA